MTNTNRCLFVRWSLIDQQDPGNGIDSSVSSIPGALQRLLQRAHGGRYPNDTFILQGNHVGSVTSDLYEPEPFVAGVEFFGTAATLAPSISLSRRIKEFGIFSHFKTDAWIPFAITETNSYLLWHIEENDIYRIFVNETDRVPEKLGLNEDDLFESAFRRLGKDWLQFLSLEMARCLFPQLPSDIQKTLKLQSGNGWFIDAIRLELPTSLIFECMSKLSYELPSPSDPLVIAWAARKNRSDLLRMLVGMGWDIHRQPRLSESAFELALSNGGIMFAKQMLLCGYRMNSRERELLDAPLILPYERSFILRGEQ